MLIPTVQFYTLKPHIHTCRCEMISIYLIVFYISGANGEENQNNVDQTIRAKHVRSKYDRYEQYYNSNFEGEDGHMM